MEVDEQENTYEIKKTMVETTIFYGESCVKNEDKYREIKYTTNVYDFCQTITEDQILNYKIHKIICKNVSNKYIGSLKIISKSRNTGEEITLLDTPCDENDLVELEPFELGELEEIISVRIWCEPNKRLTGFEVKTNKGRTSKFGYGDDTTLEKIDELEVGDKVVVGFGVYAGKELGVTGLFCYYIGKKLHAIALSSGMLYLRTKIKNKSLNSSVSKEEDEKMYTLRRVCDLSDVLFFEIAKFAVSK